METNKKRIKQVKWNQKSICTIQKIGVRLGLYILCFSLIFGCIGMGNSALAITGDKPVISEESKEAFKGDLGEITFKEMNEIFLESKIKATDKETPEEQLVKGFKYYEESGNEANTFKNGKTYTVKAYAIDSDKNISEEVEVARFVAKVDDEYTAPEVAAGIPYADFIDNKLKSQLRKPGTNKGAGGTQITWPDGFRANYKYRTGSSPNPNRIWNEYLTGTQSETDKTPSGHKLMVQENQNAEAGIELQAPVYSNTNYTLVFAYRNNRNTSNIKVGIKNNLVVNSGASYGNGKSEAYENGGNAYQKIVTKQYKITTKNNKKKYQNNDRDMEGNSIFYAYRKGGDAGPLVVEIPYARLIPNTPILEMKENLVQIPLEGNENTKASEVLAKIKDEKITPLLTSQEPGKGAVVDTNNNENPVPAELGNLLKNNDIKKPGDYFEVALSADKWGQKLNNGKIQVVFYEKEAEYDKTAHAPENIVAEPDSTVVSGNGKPGDIIVVTDTKSNKEIGRGIVGPDGNFNVTVNKKLVDKQELKLQAITGDQKSDTVSKTVKKEVIQSSAKPVNLKQEGSKLSVDTPKATEESVIYLTDDKGNYIKKDGTTVKLTDFNSAKDDLVQGKVTGEKGEILINQPEVIKKIDELNKAGGIAVALVEPKKTPTLSDPIKNLDFKAPDNPVATTVEGDSSIKVKEPADDVREITVAKKGGQPVTLTKDGDQWKIGDKPVTKDKDGNLIVPVADKVGKDDIIKVTNKNDKGVTSKADVKPEALSEFKEKQIAELDKVIAAEKKEIGEDSSLTGAERAKKLEDLDTVAKKAKEAINGPTSSEDVLKALEEQKPLIEKVHTKGDLKKVQDAAKADLTKIYDDTVKKINEDKGLTEVAKKTQIAKAEKEKNAGEKAINEATNADKVAAAKEAGKTAIEAAYKQGKLEEVQAAHKEELKKIYDKAVEDINADKGLTQAKKDEQLKKAEEALTVGNTAIDNATTADDAVKAAEANKKPIADTHKQGNLTEVQKKAKADLQKTYNATVEKITRDPGLTKAQKTEQKEAAKKLLDAGNKAIESAKDADKVLEALTVEKDKVEKTYKAGDLEEVKKAAKSKIDETETEERKDITEDKTLTELQKQEQLKQLEESKNKAYEAIDGSENADKVNENFEKENSKVAKVHKSGTGLKDRTEEAEKRLEEKAVEVTKNIQNDPTLTTAEKEKQTEDVADVLTIAKESLKNADDADKIAEALGNGIEDIESQHIHGKELDARKEAKTKSLEAELEKVKDLINNDSTLTKEDKAKQVKEAEDAAAKGAQAVKDATTADGVDNAYGDGIKEINKAHKKGKELDARKEQQKAKLDIVAKETIAEIEKDPTLTRTKKDEQIQKVNEELKKANQNIDDATDADKVDEAYGKGAADIQAQHKHGDDIETRRERHLKGLEDELKKVESLIDGDNTIKPEEKVKQKEEAKKAKEAAEKKLANKTTADELDVTYGDGVKKIHAEYKPGENLNKQKKSAKDAIERESEKVRAEIKANPTLTEKEKAAQLVNVGKEENAAITIIDISKDAGEISSALGKGIEDINKAHRNGVGIENRKGKSIEDLQKEAEKVKAVINSDPTLTNEVREKQKKDVIIALENAIKAVKKSETADKIDEELGKGFIKINKAHKSSDTLDALKEIAIDRIQVEMAKTIKAIENDLTLTKNDKINQSKKAKDATNKVIDSVRNAKNADSINEALGEGIKEINRAHKPGDGIEAKKEQAITNLKKEASRIKQAIDEDNTLNSSQKKLQKSGVEAKLLDGIKKIKEAENIEKINNVYAKTVRQINKEHKSADLDMIRAKYIKELENKAQETYTKIDSDKNLSEKEKKEQKIKLKIELNNAIRLVNSSNSATDIQNSRNIGLREISAVYKPGTTKTNKIVTKSLIPNTGDETNVIITILTFTSLLLLLLNLKKNK